jgi:hypothetical protein
MIVVVDTGAFDIQLFVHLGSAVLSDLLVDFAFLGFQLCRLAGGQLPGLYAVGNAILLVFAPLIHLIVARLLCCGIVLVA